MLTAYAIRLAHSDPLLFVHKDRAEAMSHILGVPATPLRLRTSDAEPVVCWAVIERDGYISLYQDQHLATVAAIRMGGTTHCLCEATP